MARFVRSADRAALPTFPPAALLSLIKQLVTLESKWIPQRRGYSLYIRPTIIGTKPTLGVAASSNALLYVILCPTGPYFVSGVKPIALLSSCDAMTDLTKCNPEGDPPTRSWPGGTGEYKLGINYAPSFEPQREAARRGYDQVLWLLDDINQSTKQKDRRVTEVGQMNFFMVVPGERGSMDLITPRLDGTILPGVTRSSVISLAHAHSASKPLHPTLSGKVDKINVIEKTLYMSEVARLLQEGKVTEMFGSATGAVITPIGKLGYEGVDYTIPTYEGGLGPLAKAFFDTICDIQEGHREWEDWSVLCDE
jgi:branched-chain amino acid aminotransferase